MRLGVCTIAPAAKFPTPLSRASGLLVRHTTYPNGFAAHNRITRQNRYLVPVEDVLKALVEFGIGGQDTARGEGGLTAIYLCHETARFGDQN